MAAAKKPAARKPAAPKPVAAPAKPKASARDVRIAEAYEEIPVGEGVMRAEPGDYIVTDGGVTSVMPPAVYVATHGEGA